MPANETEIERALEQFAATDGGLLATDSSIPLYYQLYRFLKRFIERGSFQQGDRFPSEEAVAACFGVSRPTASRAVQELIARGWVTRERGRGTFLQNQQLGSLALMSDNLSLTEQFPPEAVLKTQFVSREVIQGDPAIGPLLELPPDQPLLHLRRLRLVGDLPVMVCDSYLAADLFADLTEKRFVRGSLYATLEQAYGYVIERSERKISAQELMDQAIGDLLGVPVFSPVILFSGLTFVEGDERPLEYMLSYVRECIAFANVVRRRGAPHLAKVGEAKIGSSGKA
jgi:GntR family transcriptional regulator